MEEALKLSRLATWMGKNAERVKETLLQSHKAFSVEKLEMGKTDDIMHQINLTDPEPFKEQYQRIPPYLHEEVKQLLQDMVNV